MILCSTFAMLENLTLLRVWVPKTQANESERTCELFIIKVH